MNKDLAAQIVEGLNTQTHHAPRKERIKVVCMECGKKFSTTKDIPYCPRCDGADVEPRES